MFEYSIHSHIMIGCYVVYRQVTEVPCVCMLYTTAAVLTLLCVWPYFKTAPSYCSAEVLKQFLQVLFRLVKFHTFYFR